jgi:hypothetical protein
VIFINGEPPAENNRLMRTNALCAALLLTGTLGSGCATVSVVSAAGETADQIEAATATPAQQQLRAASAEFAARAGEAGWATPNGGEAARQALDVLLHGRDGLAGETREASLTPAELFIRDRAYDVADPVDVTASLAAEIREAQVRVRAVNAAAAQVFMGPPRAAWSRREDVRSAETVVQLARRARAMFHDVQDEVGDRLDAPSRTVLRRELERLDVELRRLSTAADALSAADPNVEFQRVDVISPDVG